MICAKIRAKRNTRSSPKKNRKAQKQREGASDGRKNEANLEGGPRLVDLHKKLSRGLNQARSRLILFMSSQGTQASKSNDV